jgi:hypothetical protein
MNTMLSVTEKLLSVEFRTVFKFVQETMKNYLALLEVVEKLRTMEESKVEVRGKGELSSMAEDFLKSRK